MKKLNLLILLSMFAFKINGQCWSEIDIGRDNDSAYGWSYGLTNDGLLYAWGVWNSGGINASAVFPTAQNQDVWSSVTVRFPSVMAIKSDGTLWGRGANTQHELGMACLNCSWFQQVGNDNTWIKVEMGAGIKQNGTLWIWGNSFYTPTQVGQDTNWQAVFKYDIALKEDGTLWKWGNNDNGNLGNGNNISSALPVQVLNGPYKFACSAFSHSYGIKTDGSLWGWGGAATYATGVITFSNIPIQIGTDSNWRDVARSQNLSDVLGIKEDGTIWKWGPVGSFPTQYGTETNWKTCISGRVATKEDGTVWAWVGSNPDPVEILLCNNLAASQVTGQISAIACFPNPANDILRFEVPEMTSLTSIGIFNILGEKIAFLKGEHLSEIFVGDLKSGVYLVELSSTRKKYQTKFVKF